MSSFKLGVDTYSYHRFFGEVYPGQSEPGETWSLSEFVDHMLVLPNLEMIEGVAVETCFLPEDKNEVIRELSRLDKSIIFAWGHPDGFVDATLAEVLDDIEKHLNLSQVFEAKVMRIVGSSINYFDQPHRPQIEQTLAYLEEIVPLAEKYDIRLAIENHGDFYMHELREIIETVDSPYLGLTLDTGNFLRLNERPLQAIEQFTEKVYIVHAKDVALMSGYKEDDPRRLGCVPAGKGLTDFGAIFDSLIQIDYQGMVLIEISRMHPDYEAGGETAMIAEGLNYLRGLRQEIEALDGEG